MNSYGFASLPPTALTDEQLVEWALKEIQQIGGLKPTDLQYFLKKEKSIDMPAERIKSILMQSPKLEWEGFYFRTRGTNELGPENKRATALRSTYGTTSDASNGSWILADGTIIAASSELHGTMAMHVYDVPMTDEDEDDPDWSYATRLMSETGAVNIWPGFIGSATGKSKFQLTIRGPERGITESQARALNQFFRDYPVTFVDWETYKKNGEPMRSGHIDFPKGAGELYRQMKGVNV